MPLFPPHCPCHSPSSLCPYTTYLWQGHVEPEEEVDGEGCAASVRESLTFNDHVTLFGKGKTRFHAAVEKNYQAVGTSDAPGTPKLEPPSPIPTGPGPSTSEIKAKLAAMEQSVEMGSMGGNSTEDKMDELRTVFPGKPSLDIKKLLDQAAGDVQQAIILGQSQGFTD